MGFFYRCSDAAACKCNYDLCRHCALTNCDPPVLKDKEKFNFHKCQMNRRTKDMKYDGDWCCAAVNADIFPLGQGKCETGMHPNRLHSKHIQGYYCETCDFDLCLKCVLKHKDAPPGVEEEQK